MTRLHSFKDGKFGCYANVRLDNGDPIFISVAQTGVLVKKSRIGFFGPKLYESRTVYDAAKTAEALHDLFPDYAGADGMTNITLRAFTNAVLHCSTTAEVANVLNTAIDQPRGQTADTAASELAEGDLEIAAIAIIKVYGDLLARVSEDASNKYPSCTYPESLLPIPKSALAKLLTAEIGRSKDESERRTLEGGLALLEGFINDDEANAINASILDARETACQHGDQASK
jgi:hypothetical protein